MKVTKFLEDGFTFNDKDFSGRYTSKNFLAGIMIVELNKIFIKNKKLHKTDSIKYYLWNNFIHILIIFCNLVNSIFIYIFIITFAKDLI